MAPFTPTRRPGGCPPTCPLSLHPQHPPAPAWTCFMPHRGHLPPIRDLSLQPDSPLGPACLDRHRPSATKVSRVNI